MIPNKHSNKYTLVTPNKHKLRVLLSVSLNLSHLTCMYACLTCSGILSNLNNSPQKIIVLATLLRSLNMYIGTNCSTRHYFLSLCYHNKHTHTHTMISIVTCTYNVQSCNMHSPSLCPLCALE